MSAVASPGAPLRFGDLSLEPPAIQFQLLGPLWLPAVVAIVFSRWRRPLSPPKRVNAVGTGQGPGKGTTRGEVASPSNDGIRWAN